jgi:hypothetical protein
VIQDGLFSEPLAHFKEGAHGGPGEQQRRSRLDAANKHKAKTFIHGHAGHDNTAAGVIHI